MGVVNGYAATAFGIHAGCIAGVAVLMVQVQTVVLLF